MAQAADRETHAIAPARAALMLVLAGGLSALSETMLPTILGSPAPMLDAGHLLLGLLALGMALGPAGHVLQWAWPRPAVVVGLAVVGSLLAGWLGGVAWPNSGDEYSYLFMADTFASGRLFVPAPPDTALLETFHILTRDGIAFSPYPPLWAAVVVPFRLLGVVWLANPLLTACLGAVLAGAMRAVQPAAAVQGPALALVLLTPFTLFLGGSLFPQTLACTLTAGIVWAQLADEARPAWWRKVLVGGLFGLLLLTRFDVAGLVLLAFAADRLWVRRWWALADGLLVLAGVLPFLLALGAYNAAITGDPLLYPGTWAGPSLTGLVAEDAAESPVGRAAAQDVYFIGTLAQFSGLPVAALGLVGLVAKLRARRGRFYDWLLPVALLAFTFIPFSGDHQYGPRYWFWAWPFALLTALGSVIDAGGQVRVGRKPVPLAGFAGAALVCAAAGFCVLLLTTHAYIDARRAVFDTAPPPGRAVVLVPNRWLWLWPWQRVPLPAANRDFTRSGTDFDGPVLYGRDDLPDSVERACRLPGRVVYRWQSGGIFESVSCQ